MIEMPLDKCTNDDSSGPGPNNDDDDNGKKTKCCKPMRKKTGQSMLPTLHDKKCPATMKELPFDKCTNDDSSGPGPNNDNDDGDGDNDDKCCKKRTSKTPEKFKNKCPRGMIEMPLDKCTNDDSSGPGPNNDNDDDDDDDEDDDDGKKCCKSKNAKSPS